MARPTAQGIDYFPLDVDFLHDIKIRKIIRAQGLQSVAILVDLLSNIYRDEGYYMRWGEDELFLTADMLGVTEGAVSELVNMAVNVGFFDRNMKETYGILTSKSIQKRFFKAVERRKSISYDARFLLISVNVDNNGVSSGVNVCNNPARLIVNVSNNEQSIVKESIVKESIVEKSKSDHSLFNEIVEDFSTYCFGKVDSISLERVRTTVQEYGDTWVKAAMSIAYGANKVSWGYVEGILRSWASKYNLDDEPWKIERGNIGGSNRTKSNNQFTPEYYEGDAEQL